MKELTGLASQGKGMIGVLLPDTTSSARYVTYDAPFLKMAFEAAGLTSDQYKIDNAQGSASTMQQQAEADITAGASVLLIDPLDPGSGAAIEANAESKGVRVIDYDRLVTGGPEDRYYVSFNNITVGKTIGQGEIDCISAWKVSKPNILIMDGDPADNNAKLFKKGAEDALKSGGVKIAKSFDTPGWSADKAQNEMQQSITSLGNSGFAGVLAANDDLGGGAIAAMKSAGVKPSDRPTTGQDATVAGLQRILEGEQFMTVWKAIAPEAGAAAQIAVALAKGDDVPSDLINQQVNNGQKDVPSVILKPAAIIKNNVNDVIKGGDAKASDVCKGQYKSACEQAGISTQ